MLHRLRHPNITQLYGLWRGYDPDLAEMRVFMVLEFCGGGTLAEAVDMRDSEVSVCHISRWSQQWCVSVCVRVCLGFCLGERGGLAGLWCKWFCAHPYDVACDCVCVCARSFGAAADHHLCIDKNALGDELRRSGGPPALPLASLDPPRP